jgi:hypothetical protein
MKDQKPQETECQHAIRQVSELGTSEIMFSTPPAPVTASDTLVVSTQTETVAVAIDVVTDVDVVVEVAKDVTGISDVSMIVLNTTIVVAGVVTVGIIVER